MDIVTSAVGETRRIQLNGRVDALEAGKLKAELDQHISDSTSILVDLTDVEFLDSSGLAVLVKCWRTQTSAGGTLSVVLPAAEVARRVFDLTGFDQVFDIVDPDAAAL